MSTVTISIPQDADFAMLANLPLAVWQSMPTLHQGHTDNLKFASTTFKVWTSRMSRADYAEGIEGAKAFSNERLTIEKLIDGVWTTLDQYGRVK